MKGALPSLDAAAIARRKPLWIALSDLYLDTWSEHFVPYVVRCAREGGFSLDEVELVLRWEVRPALFHNLLCVAGEWAGWDETWLVERILDCMQRRPPFLIGKNRFMPHQWAEIAAALGGDAPSG